MFFEDFEIRTFSLDLQQEDSFDVLEQELFL